jgi:hypothetical protein
MDEATRLIRMHKCYAMYNCVHEMDGANRDSNPTLRQVLVD